jgi:hypothetical protein
MDEQEPIDEAEFVYRRIHPKFYKSSAPVPVLYEAFRPSQSDAQPEDCLMAIDPAAVRGYAVARLFVRDLRRLGFTVQPDRITGGPPGHAIIAELSWNGYQADKKNWKPILFELAKLAGADIVHRPT